MMLFNPIFLIEPELAHRLAILTLKCLPFTLIRRENNKLLNCSVCGMDFINPIGIAAGFDKNAECIKGLFSVGFGFVEVGTVTPVAQSGNKKPRVFRLIEDKAVINSLGFNNKGVEHVKRKLVEYRKKDTLRSIVGVNIGKNAKSKDYIADYLSVFEIVYPFVDYVTINISSPNTKGLRDLQNYDSLLDLLKALNSKKSFLAKEYGDKKIFVKISPDISNSQKESIASSIIDGKADGIVATNTTLSRPSLLSKDFAFQKGGLSGSPLFDISTSVLRDIYVFTEGEVPIIGVGGVNDGETAYKKIKMGASLVQLYSSMIYSGPLIVNKINSQLIDIMQREGISSIAEVRGRDAKF